DAIGDDASVRPAEEHRQELEGGHGAEEEAVVGQLQDEPSLRHPLHPGAGHGDELPGEVQAVVPDSKRPEGPGGDGAWAHRASSTNRSRTGRARSSAARSSGLSRDRRFSRYAVFLDRAASTNLWPSGVSEIHATLRSSASE